MSYVYFNLAIRSVTLSHRVESRHPVSESNLLRDFISFIVVQTPRKTVRRRWIPLFAAITIAASLSKNHQI